MKKWLIIAVCLMVVGLAVSLTALGLAGFDFMKLGTQNMKTKVYEPKERFWSIQMDVTTGDIAILPSPDGKVQVVCYEEEKVPFNATVEEDTLVIRQQDQRKWYDHIGLHLQKPSVTVYLPAGQYGDLQIQSTTGDIRVTEDFLFQNADIALTTGDVKWSSPVEMNLSVCCTTGDVEIADITCGMLNIENRTGDVELERTQAFEKLTVSLTTGDVELNRVDAGTISIIATTGDITCKLLTDKYFVADTTTGDVTVPVSGGGGQCYLKTTTGDIEAEIIGER